MVNFIALNQQRVSGEFVSPCPRIPDVVGYEEGAKWASSHMPLPANKVTGWPNFFFIASRTWLKDVALVYIEALDKSQKKVGCSHAGAASNRACARSSGVTQPTKQTGNIHKQQAIRPKPFQFLEKKKQAAAATATTFTSNTNEPPLHLMPCSATVSNIIIPKHLPNQKMYWKKKWWQRTMTTNIYSLPSSSVIATGLQLWKCIKALFSSLWKPKSFQDSLLHRILWHMHETLNIDENKN